MWIKNALDELVYRNFHGSVPIADNMIAEVLKLAFYKSTLYESEREWRAVIYQDPLPTPGIRIGVDVNALVERIVVSPGAPPFLLPAVRAVVERFECTVPVEMSSALTPPSGRRV
jgi:hypothetical protein